MLSLCHSALYGIQSGKVCFDGLIRDTTYSLISKTLAIYDRELSLSERSVKIYDITHNSSHIQGKYTVHILPEGLV